jgi:hypothetical protein
VRRTTIWPLACAVSVVVGVSACTSSTGQSETTSAATTESATASPSQSAGPSTAPTSADPGIPAAARAATADGAQQFVRYWVSQFNAAQQKPDADMLALISTPECRGCQAFLSEIRQLQAEGKRVDGDVWEVNTTELSSFENAATAVVFSNIHQLPAARVDRSGAVLTNYKDRTDDYGFTLTHDGTMWRVSRLQVLQ